MTEKRNKCTFDGAHLKPCDALDAASSNRAPGIKIETKCRTIGLGQIKTFSFVSTMATIKVGNSWFFLNSCPICSESYEPFHEKLNAWRDQNEARES